MSPIENSFCYRLPSWTMTATVPFLLVASIVISGCVVDGAGSAGKGFSGLNWFGSPQPAPPQTVTLSRDPAFHANGSKVERAIYHSVELSRQKRFTEARQLLAEARAMQVRQTDGYRAISCAMALMALREGDITTFRRIARQLDASLGRPIEVDHAYLDVIGVYRAMNKEPLPVNAHNELTAFKVKYFGTQSAGVQSKGPKNDE